MPVEKAHREAGRGIRAMQVRSSSFVGAEGSPLRRHSPTLRACSHEPACQVDELDAVSAGCFVTGFCDDRLRVRVANLLQARDLALEGAHRLSLSRGLAVRATAMSWQKSLVRP